MINFTEITLTIGGVSRKVALEYLDPNERGERDKGYITGHASGVVATIGRGSARYPDMLSLWPVTDKRPAIRGNEIATAADGSVWQYHYGTCVRNRQAQIVGWAADMPVTNEQNQTRSAR
jgi:hypothetical protein